MLNQAKKLLGHKYVALNTIEVSADRLKKNYLYLSSLDPSIKIAPVVKSNAYGHGLSLLAKLLDKLNAPLLCVDSLYEAYELMKAGVKTKILVMGFIHPTSFQTKKLPFSFTVFEKKQIQAIAKHQPHASIHLFVDTGMHREGIALDELPDLISYTLKKTPLEIEGLMSHFAFAQKPRNPLTKKQVSAFKKAQSIVQASGISPRWSHLAASSGLLSHKYFADGLGNLARVGKGFYGYIEHQPHKKLLPALTFNTRIAQIKFIEKGKSIGYDFTYTARKKIKIAILPVGYNDGVDRRLSNNGFVSIAGKYCPIIGRVSMNITTIDISRLPNPFIGQKVTIYSNNSNHKNSIVKTAAACQTIALDLLVNLNPTVKRVLKK
jgi:alanine racemase